MTEEQAKIYLEELTKLKDAQWQLQKNYMAKFLTVLPAKKVAMLPQAEKEIQVAVKLRARQLRQHPGQDESVPAVPDEE
jgi:tRNA U34 2-thiouridine synthase MnmA/TrmU